MKYSPKEIWQQPLPAQLISALVSISDADILRKFLRDVMTEKEIIEISARLEAARLLQEGVAYTKISQQTKLSSRTVARISDWLKNGCGGYKSVLISLHHQHKSLPGKDCVDLKTSA